MQVFNTGKDFRTQINCSIDPHKTKTMIEGKRSKINCSIDNSANDHDVCLKASIGAQETDHVVTWSIRLQSKYR
jgi:hypothetical protein